MLEIKGLSLFNRQTGEPSTLHPYQDTLLTSALDNPDNFYFFNCGTGTGKTVMAVAGAQELINRDEIDLALVFTLRQVKRDFTAAATDFTELQARNIEGNKKYRRAEYQKQDANVYVMNYEKARFDNDDLLELIEGKRVLFVFDEVQKILSENKSQKAINSLIDSVRTRYIWPMSASVIRSNPERYWRVYEWLDTNPLGTLRDFYEHYVESTEIRTRKIRRGPRWHYFNETIRTYDFDELAKIPNIVAPWTGSVRKSDPGVREYFKGITFEPVIVPMSPEDEQLYKLIEKNARKVKDSSSISAFYWALRYTCLTTESHLYSQNKVSKTIVSSGVPLSSSNSWKLERVLDDLETLRDAGEKCVVFTHWTNLSLLILSREMEKRNISHVRHYGGMSDQEMHEAKVKFKSDPSICVFLSSDAGSHGLSFQEARVVINYDCPTNYDDLMQRNDRIDRADSYLDGLEARVYLNEGSIEERIWAVNNYRRMQASAIQGTVESLSRLSPELVASFQVDEEALSSDQREFLMFGAT